MEKSKMRLYHFLRKKKKWKLSLSVADGLLFHIIWLPVFLFKEERNKYVEKGRNDVSDLLGFHSFPYVEIFFLLVPTLESWSVVTETKSRKGKRRAKKKNNKEEET